MFVKRPSSNLEDLYGQRLLRIFPELEACFPFYKWCAEHTSMAEAAEEWCKVLWAHTESAPAPVPFYVGRLVDAVSHHVHGPSVGRSFSAVAKSKSFFKPVIRSSVEHDMLETLWLGTECSGSADRLVIIRLLRKGLPTPTSIRYVGEQLRRASVLPVVATIIRRFVLGDYVDAVYVAPFDIRQRLNDTGIDVLADIITDIFTNRDVFYVVAEYLIAETTDHTALLHALRPTVRWSTYIQQIQHITNTRLRPQFVNHCRRLWGMADTAAVVPLQRKLEANAKPIAARNLIGYYGLTSSMVMGLLSKLLRIRPGQLPRPASTPSTLSAASVIADFAKPTLGGGFCTSLLQMHGMSRTTCERLIAAQHTGRSLTAFVRSLSPTDKYLLGLAVAAVLHRNITTALVAHFNRPTTKSTYIVICRVCLTLCSRFKGDARRNTSQINVCLAMQQPRCAVCQNNQLLYVPANLASVVVGGRTVTKCDACNKLSLSVQSVGTDFLCEACASKRQAAAVITTCFCGRSGVDVKMFAAKNGNVLQMFAACNRHIAAVPRTTIVDVRAITARCHRDRQPYKPT